MPKAAWRDEVLKFWFEELTPEDHFSGKPEIDEKIRARFGGLYEALKAGPPADAAADPESALAAIIVLDQFPRNMFRKTPQAFATDPLAATIARQALDVGFDARLGADRRQFLYMPLMHSENLADQERCVALMRATGNEKALEYALEHRDIVARFGRFPHRNKTLGRPTTAEEADFLTGHSGYGQ